MSSDWLGSESRSDDANPALVRPNFNRREICSSGRLYDDKDGSDGPAMTQQQFDPKMLEYLVCPLSKEPLRYKEDTQELICDHLGIAYKINNGIPNLIPGDARKISDAQKGS